MSTISNLDLECTTTKPDCDKNSIVIGNQCFPVEQISNVNNNNSVFTKQLYDTLYKKPLLNQDNISLFECISQCNSNDSCQYIKFLYGDSDVENKEISDFGLCNIYNQEYKTIGEEKKDFNLPINATGNPNDLGYSNASIYKKENYNKTNQIDIQNHTKTKALRFDLTKGKYPEQELPIIQSKYMGVDCRQYAAERKLTDDSANDDMAGFCKNNKDLKICNTYCNDDNGESYCSDDVPYSMYIPLTIGLLCLFIALFLWTRKYQMKVDNVTLRYPVEISLIVIGCGLLGYFIYLYLYYKTPWQGTKSDATNWNYYTDCDDNGYTSVLNENEFPWYKACSEIDESDTYCYIDNITGDNIEYPCDKKDQSIFGECNCQSEPTRENNSPIQIGVDGNFRTGVTISSSNILFDGSVYEYKSGFIGSNAGGCAGVDLSDGRGCGYDGILLNDVCETMDSIGNVSFKYLDDDNSFNCCNTSNNTCNSFTPNSTGNCSNCLIYQTFSNISKSGPPDNGDNIQLTYTKQNTDVQQYDICDVSDSTIGEYNIPYDVNGRLIPYTRSTCNCKSNSPVASSPTSVINSTTC